MIPIKDKTLHARRSFPFVNLTIIAVNVIIFYFEANLPLNRLEALIYGYGFIPEKG